MRAAARTDDAIAAECILQLFGGRQAEGIEPEARAVVGALYFLELVYSLRAIVKSFG